LIESLSIERLERDMKPHAHALLAFGLASLSLAAAAAAAQSPYAPDVPEPGSVEAIAQFTTDPRFVSPWVAYLPESSSVPSPTDYLGHVVGAAGELSVAAKIYGYLRQLAAASDRIHLEVIGKSEEGREILLVAIADEAGIRQLARLKAATAALADPRVTSPEQMERLIPTARPIYYFNAGLHSDESGSAEMVMELAYRLAVSQQPMIEAIRRNLVVLINPVSEPDGRDKMVDWFYRYLKGKTDYQRLPRQSPPYWSHYVYVDINRDAHQKAFQTTRAVHRMFYDYHPTTVHDLHEAIALLQTWNGTGPYNPNLDPIVTSEFLELSFHEMTAMIALGMPGVWTWKFGEGFGHHYLDSVAMNHNSIGRGYETFGNATAETVERTLEPSEITREWYRPWPAPRNFRWSMRDNTNYMETGCLAVLDYTAKHAQELLRDFYLKGYKSWQRGLNQPPYAFVIPPDQGDRRRVAQMVSRLIDQQIEVSRAAEPFTIGPDSFEAGSYVVRLDQPYRNYAVDLLAPQEFPRDAEYQPYDDVSWALPIHYGVEAKPIDDPHIQEMEFEPLTGELHPIGAVRGQGPVYLLKDTGQEALLAARYRLKDRQVEIAEVPFQAGGVDYSPGSWIVAARDGLEPALKSIAQELALDFDAVSIKPEVRRHLTTPPRLGVWVPWADTNMIGWIRYTLDQEKIPYTYIRDDDIKAGDLGRLVDVIVYGQVRLDLQAQIHGIAPTAGPMPYTHTPEFPSHGVPAASDDITGGIGWNGLANLQQFVEQGGVLITLGNASTLALDGGMIRNVRPASVEGVSTPGAELRVRFTQPRHPIAYGYPEITSAFRSNYTVYDLPRRWLEMSYCTSCLDGPVDTRFVVLQWGTRELDAAAKPIDQAVSAAGVEPMVVSGGARNEDALEGRPAILDVPTGEGRIIAFNFNPMHRDLNHSDYRFLWNAILNWNSLPPSPQ
jgi:hypothetical protein